MAKKGKKDKGEKKGKGKRGKLPKRKREREYEQRTTYDTAVSALGRIVCIYAVLTFLGIVLAVVFGVLGTL